MTTTISPVVRSVVVPCDPAEAFRLFTGEIGRWWPMTTHSVGGADAVDVTLEPQVGGRIVENLRSGGTVDWGTVTTWSPPDELAMTWHPGYGAENGTDVHVRFEPHADGTLVTLEHTGWERLADGPAKRADYDTGWVPVLADFASLAGAKATSAS